MSEEEKTAANGNNFDRVLEFSDDIERRVEEYRDNAKRLIQDRKGLEETLAMLEDSLTDFSLSEVDSEEVRVNIERLQTRIQTVEVNVLHHRDPIQEESLQKIDMKIAELVSGIESEEEPERGVSERLQSYLNACSEGSGSQDLVFEKLILSCSSEDQKSIKLRLEDLSRCVNVIATNSKKTKTEGNN